MPHDDGKKRLVIYFLTALIVFTTPNFMGEVDKFDIRKLGNYFLFLNGSNIMNGTLDMGGFNITNASEINTTTAIIGSYPDNYTYFDENGTITLHGEARVTKRLFIPSNGIRGIGLFPSTEGLNDNGFYVWVFPDNLERYVQANLPLPTDLDQTENISINIGWSSPTVSQNADWELTFLITSLDEDTDQAGTLLQGYFPSSATANGMAIASFEINASEISNGELCIHIQIMRDGNDAGDTLGAIAELHGVAVFYVSDKLGG